LNIQYYGHSLKNAGYEKYQYEYLVCLLKKNLDRIFSKRIGIFTFRFSAEIVCLNPKRNFVDSVNILL